MAQEPKLIVYAPDGKYYVLDPHDGKGFHEIKEDSKSGKVTIPVARKALGNKTSANIGEAEAKMAEAAGGVACKVVDLKKLLQE